VSRAEFRCKCPIWVTGTKDGKPVREALKLRDWNRAQELVRKWDVDGSRPKPKLRSTIHDWQDVFLKDAEHGRHLSRETIRLYKLLFRQLTEWAESKGIQYVNELDLESLTEFRSTWKVGALAASKRLERLRSVLKFALQRKMTDENSALNLSSPKVKPSPTLPFTDEEIKQILEAADSPEIDPRVKAFILTMRYSGLRISDTASLKRDALIGNRLRLYQAKTGEPVSILIPKEVVAALHKLPSKSDWFFWTGQSRTTTVTGFWRARIAKVFKLAKLENAYSHRFRDTFAVSLLNAGASLENVSVLLGHTSIRVTQKHYNPWVKSRQDALDLAVKKALRS
jgi:site-specific recombinase XerD